MATYFLVPRRDANPAVAPGGFVHGSVTDIDGRRYSTHPLQHRVVFEGADGEFVAIGRRGEGAGEFAYPQGLALLPGTTASQTRLFVCDTLNHRIQVLDGDGMPVVAFGGHGSGPGQFRAPADIAIVTPDLPGERDTEPEPLLAVADQWNGRIQMLTLDGAFVAAIGTRARRAPRWNAPAAAGWPFFRLIDDPVLRLPAHLTWRAPYLDVECANGRRVRLDLALAMLPGYDDWRVRATPSERARAVRYFRLLRGHPRELPQALFTELAGAAWPAAA